MCACPRRLARIWIQIELEVDVDGNADANAEGGTVLDLNASCASPASPVLALTWNHRAATSGASNDGVNTARCVGPLVWQLGQKLGHGRLGVRSPVGCGHPVAELCDVLDRDGTSDVVLRQRALDPYLDGPPAAVTSEAPDLKHGFNIA
eukprot:CAMPEP_0175270248 /NCGR_PEP_ID=MMETSP0093-20121207/45283_1 /TAXON_ID=311494 /ORGANISM="Alexandrium monilatum, Strain CCMP3105" /LENGTH=148 /DNA_ID=CAMNT_0016564943 /DNA_START=30 /DNA_END=473 /DNA_ORIENTATION=+